VVERTEIADPRVFQGYDLPFAIENDSSKKQFTLPQQVEEFLSQNQKFRFNFDFAHSSEISRFLTQSFIEKQGSRMAQVISRMQWTHVKTTNFYMNIIR
jgi:hypothetical protein